MWYIYFSHRPDKWSYCQESGAAFPTRAQAHERLRHVVRINRQDEVDFVYRVVWRY